MIDMNDFVAALEHLADARKRLEDCRNDTYYDPAYVCRNLEDEVDEAEKKLGEVFETLVNERVASFASGLVTGKEGLLETLTRKPGRWEFRVEKNLGSFDNLPQFLGRISQDGWEVVQVLPLETLATYYRVLLRRPVYE